MKHIRCQEKFTHSNKNNSFVTTLLMYQRQQNKCYLKGVRKTSTAELCNEIWLVLLWASKFATAKSRVAWKWASKHLWEGGNIYFAGNDTTSTKLKILSKSCPSISCIVFCSISFVVIVTNKFPDPMWRAFCCQWLTVVLFCSFELEICLICLRLAISCFLPVFEVTSFSAKSSRLLFFFFSAPSSQDYHLFQIIIEGPPNPSLKRTCLKKLNHLRIKLFRPLVIVFVFYNYASITNRVANSRNFIFWALSRNIFGAFMFQCVNPKILCLHPSGSYPQPWYKSKLPGLLRFLRIIRLW